MPKQPKAENKSDRHGLIRAVFITGMYIEIAQATAKPV